MKFKTGITLIAIISILFVFGTLSADNRNDHEKSFLNTPGRQLQEPADFVLEEDLADPQAPSTSPEDSEDNLDALQTNVATNPNTTPHPLSGAPPVLVTYDPETFINSVVVLVNCHKFVLCRDNIICAQNEWMDINPVSNSRKDAILVGLFNRYKRKELELKNHETFLGMPLIPTNAEERETRITFRNFMEWIPRERLKPILRDICNPFDLSTPIDIPRVKEIIIREKSLCYLALGQSSSDLASQMLDDSTRAKSTQVAKWSVDYELVCGLALMLPQFAFLFYVMQFFA